MADVRKEEQKARNGTPRIPISLFCRSCCHALQDRVKITQQTRSHGIIPPMQSSI